ncbi:glycosyltransferase family 2 protein [Virgibacillus sp. 19R1-5]|uniref:Glycosyl transferase family 2 n=2 Tax=Virgibacillus pantothenticus TaxID=1473 RepID=A0A0L0QTR7_VIRPA|nr:glycosyltransferase family 2 protein [Virgibacillus sp. 6R]KNE21588.1 glycosyl transferase family 2 [Virgibacillus pantothenticus]MBS7427894.1 glycosyltransferase family 2 protein [Virgibacillus sp. 19R1-5]API91772.1 glycosyl transferase family 2 [Virgibacillus sp. 6R]MED3738242.1 glycosyltransferase family 2 protein [Virgibacillus pantothenticus]QTY15987.1 glycosyltransferase family 2 protein [Virgibacillus pantothenticus]
MMIVCLESIPKTLIIVPAYNEQDTIGKTLSSLVELKEEIRNLEICVVNDGSTDRTKDIVSTFDVVQLDLSQNLGIGGAVQTGYKYAYNQGFDIAVQFDADGQHKTSDLFDLITPIINDEEDMVIGSRFLHRTDYKGSKLRRIGIYYFYVILKLLTKKSYTDPTSGYRAINRHVIELFANDYPKDYPEPEVLMHLSRKKMRIKEVTANMQGRQGGESSITPWKSIYYMGKVTLSILMQSIVKE